jgi:Fe-S cluster assembly iron-binding protein IscA
MANKQTAVDFLYEFVLLKLSNEQQMQFEGLFQQAKQMQKEQMIDMWVDGNTTFIFNGTAVDYYNETYKQQENDN